VDRKTLFHLVSSSQANHIRYPSCCIWYLLLKSPCLCTNHLHASIHIVSFWVPPYLPTWPIFKVTERKPYVSSVGIHLQLNYNRSLWKVNWLPLVQFGPFCLYIRENKFCIGLPVMGMRVLWESSLRPEFSEQHQLGSFLRIKDIVEFWRAVTHFRDQGYAKGASPVGAEILLRVRFSPNAVILPVVYVSRSLPAFVRCIDKLLIC